MNGWGIFFVIVVVLVVFGSIGWVFYARYRAQRLGLPPPPLNPFARRRGPGQQSNYTAPAPAPGGIQGWISDKIASLRNQRTTTGGYESTGYGVGRSSTNRGRSGRGGFGPLDPDEAWDARVGNEADYYGGPAGYEEQELELQDPGHGPYGGGGYGGNPAIGVAGIPEDRGRSRSRQRELDARYDEEVHGGGGGAGGAGAVGGKLNPFDDRNEAASLRASSPRPMDDRRPHSRGISAHRPGQASLGTNHSGEDESPTERRSMFREDV